jgi:hypothetical protein
MGRKRKRIKQKVKRKHRKGREEKVQLMDDLGVGE